MSQLQVTGEAKIRDIQGPVVANSGVITALDGAASQYVRGDGTLADFPTSSGGGSSVSYYLNSSVSQGTIGGVAYRELSKEPIIGAGTDISISANGYVASYLTDVNDPDVVLIPGGNFNCEFYFSVNNETGNPFFYAELYKYDGTTFTLLGSSVGVPEYITQGTTIAPYYFAIPVATATLALTDRLAIRIYVNVDGRTVTLHTENGHLCQVVTTLSKGMVSLNNLTDQSQFLAVGTSGTNFAIVSSGDTHTFNLPVASATNTGKLSSTDWSTFNNKQNALTNPITGTGANGQVTYFNGTTSVTSTSNLFWDNANSFLGVGTNVPSAGITSFSSTPAFQFKAAGAAPAITFSDTLTSASLACVFGLATSNNQFITGTAAGDMAIANQSTSAGAIVFGTGTTERMRMTSSGTLSIGNTNSTYKLDVTGTVRFTGELTGSSAVFSSTVRPSSSFGADLGTSSFRWNDIYGFSLTLTSSVTALSIIKSGGTSSQFLMADGSVNTSVLPSGAYLPLTGGTLTGALSGTSATFSGQVEGTIINSTSNAFRFSGSNALSLVTLSGQNVVKINSAGYWGVQLVGANDQGIVINNVGQVGLGTATPTNRLTISNNGNATIAFRINDTNANASFLSLNASDSDSAIIAGGTSAIPFDIYTGGVARMRITSGGDTLFQFAGNRRIGIDYDYSGNYFYGFATNSNARQTRIICAAPDSNAGISFQTGASFSSATEKMLITSGGNVGIGTSAPLSFTSYTTAQISNTAGGGLFVESTTGSIIGQFFADNGFAGGASVILGSRSNHPLVFTTNNTERMRITSGGNVYINKTTNTIAPLGTPSLQVNNEIMSNGSLSGIFWENRNGGVTTNSNWGGLYWVGSVTYLFNGSGNAGSFNMATGAYTPLSDINKKKDFEDSTIGLNAIMGLKPTLYRMKSDETNSSKELGFIAQEVKEFIPQAYVESGEGEDVFIGLQDRPIIAALVKAVQEQQAQIEELKAKTNRLFRDHYGEQIIN